MEKWEEREKERKRARKKWGRSMKVAEIVSIVVSMLVTAFLIPQGYVLNRDITAVAHRAQVASDATDMLGYMRQFKSGMEYHGLTKGHTALIFKTPANDLEQLNRSIDQIIARLEVIKEIPKSETAYQVALDDLRGTIRELESPTLGYLWVQYWFLFLLFGIWIWPVVRFLRMPT